MKSLAENHHGNIVLTPCIIWKIFYLFTCLSICTWEAVENKSLFPGKIRHTGNQCLYIVFGFITLFQDKSKPNSALA